MGNADAAWDDHVRWNSDTDELVVIITYSDLLAAVARPLTPGTRRHPTKG